MFPARVIGTATTTVRHRSYRGLRLLICELIDETREGTGKITVAGDWLGAGKGDRVIITADGDAAMKYTGDPKGPLRNVIVGIIDGIKGVSQ